MPSEPTDRIRSLYREAIERPPAERARFVAEHAGDDVELRASVERLLEQHRTEMAEVRTTATLAPGSMLGVYRLEGRIGAGGMGEVFRAADTRLDRKVAIKVSATRFDERFEREARILSSLNHPHICTLYDVGPNYLVMELIEGETLDSRIARGPLPFAEAARCGAEIADALAEAHRVGIVHRDLKPQNVMLTRHGVKVLDFGIAKLATDDRLTRMGSIIGTAAYLAPEQLAGEPATERSDLYALGVVLHELATGSRPAAGARAPRTSPKPGAAIARSIGREAATPAKPFDDLLAKLLDPDPARRPGSAAEVAARLRAIASPLRVAPSRRVVILIAAAAVVAAVAGGLWLREPAESARRTVPAPLAKLRIAILPFENLSPDPGNAFFTDGLHEEILTALANDAPDLEVISRTTMESYKGKPVTIEQLAKDLACNYVLEGSVRREDADVRLTLQLIDAKTDGHVWARNYDRKLVSAMTLQSEVAGQVAAQLSVKLASGDRVATARTNDPRAYDFYLKARLARETLNGDAPASDWLNVAELATRSIEIDPRFALAYVERFGVYFYLRMQYPDADGGHGRLAQADLDALRRLAPNDAATVGAEAQSAFAEQDFGRASELFARARAAGLADPNVLIWDVTLHQFVGDLDRTLADLDRALALDPGNLNALFVAGLNLAAAHRYADALKPFDLALAKAPDVVLFQIQRPFLEFETTGDDAAREEINRLKGPEPPFEADHFVTFRWTQGYAELRDRLDRTSPREIRFGLFVYLPVFGDTRVPIEWLRGQLDRQLGDGAAAAKDGQAIVAYAARQTESKWNRWFLRYLMAEGRALQGDNASAVKAAHEALELSPDGGSGVWPVAPFLVATVLAGAGAEDEAAALLDRIAFSSPGVMPAEILRTAELSVPLANNVRFRALKKKLESQMAENRKLFSAAER